MVHDGNQRGVLSSGFEFVNWRDSDWDSVTEYTPGGSSEIDSSAAPIQTNAVPITEPTTQNPAGIKIVSTGFGDARSGLTNPASLLPSDLDIQTMDSDEYNASTSIAFRYDGQVDVQMSDGTVEEADYDSDVNPDDVAIDDLEVNTFPPSVDSEIVEEGDQDRVYGTDISAKITDETEDEYTVEIELTRESGDPIELSSDDGYILVQGEGIEERIRTDSSGTVTMTVPAETRGRLRMEFNPDPWWKASPSEPAYVASSGDVNLGTGPGLLALIYRIFDVSWLGVVLLLIAYGVYKRHQLGRHI